MKSLLFSNVTLTESSTKDLTITISRKALYVSTLVITAIIGIFLPMMFIVFGTLVIAGAGFSIISFYRDISALDFSSEDYSLTLEEIIEDLEG